MRLAKCGRTGIVTAAVCWWVVLTADATDRVVVLVDTSLYEQVEVNLMRYEAEVEDRFPVDLQVRVDGVNGWSPEAIRTYLQHEYGVNQIDGVILVGRVQYPLWEQGFGGNWGILSFFYEDLDGSFTDTDDDGMYDWHEWGARDGPEIWSCWMRPPVMDEAGYLNALLDEAHDYYTGVFVTTKRAMVACHQDYDNNFWPGGSTIPSMPALVDIYGLENVATDGEEDDLVYASELKAELFAGDYEIFHGWSHAYNAGEAWDVGWIASYDVMTAPTGSGPLIAHIYGCHSGDFIGYEGESYDNTTIAIAYAFGLGAGQAGSGTSWSYGTEGMNYITEAMRDGAYLGQAWKHLLDLRENSEAIQERYPDRDVHTELSGNNLFGNPFLWANWSGGGVLPGVLEPGAPAEPLDAKPLPAP